MAAGVQLTCISISTHSMGEGQVVVEGVSRAFFGRQAQPQMPGTKLQAQGQHMHAAHRRLRTITGGLPVQVGKRAEPLNLNEGARDARGC